MSFLSTIGGARTEILEQCPSEGIRFQSLGAAILVTSFIATISIWFALYSAMGASPFLAPIIALAWGGIILVIDRWLVSSIPISGPTRWAAALPRLLLAVLLGSIISTPIVLRVFESEINTQIALIKQQRAAAF